MDEIVAQGVPAGHGDAADANQDGTVTRSEAAAYDEGNVVPARNDSSRSRSPARATLDKPPGRGRSPARKTKVRGDVNMPAVVLIQAC